jgi:GH15 family glucan-1,4-alpha-glucosidase
MDLSRLGLIGNCQLSALVDARGCVVFCCMPRFDSEPIFGSLLDPEGGGFHIGPADGSEGVQSYIPNTNVLTTTFTTADGTFRLVDFAPRFSLNERSFRPTKILRIVEPISGTPRVRVRCEPVLGWSKSRPQREFGSHHVRFLGFGAELRLTANAPLSYLDGEAFALTRPIHFVLSWGTPVEEPLEALCDRFRSETVNYWQRWVKHCDVPLLHQEEVIRSALALKLQCFEDTGAIVAAPTTSIPEAPGSGRTWDYRYCWLRDAYYTLEAFRLLGHFEEREQFLEFLLNVAGSSGDLDLAPLYRVDGRTDLEETLQPNWAGYEGNGPVRVGNGAALHKQHDVFGEMVLALTPMFLDARFRDHVTAPVLDLVTRLARKAILVAGQPDAGIWEYRTEWRPQTFSTLMCWSAADRMAHIARRHRPALETEFRTAAVLIEREVSARAVDPTRDTLVADYGGKEVDAALLQAVTLRLLRRERSSSARDGRRPSSGGPRAGRLATPLPRSTTASDVPTVAFTFSARCGCVEALVRGRPQTDEAREAAWPEAARRIRRASRSPGRRRRSERRGRMWGNFPQAYSHAGLVHAAFAVSPRFWDGTS